MNRYFTIILICASVLLVFADKITYVSMERPFVEVNPKFITDGNVTARRHGRHSPVYYVDLHFVTVLPVDNNIKIDYYFYEFLSNQYKRGFVEMHGRACSIINKNLLIGAMFKRALGIECPAPPGVYHLLNLTVLPSAIPPGFPFTKGRVYVNATYVPTNETLCTGHIDIELRKMTVKNWTKTSWL